MPYEQTDSWRPSRRQGRLRRAFVDGDLRTVRTLLQPASCSSWWAWLTGARKRESPAALLSCIYEDDWASPSLHYLFTGTLISHARMPGSLPTMGREFGVASAHRRLCVLRWLLSDEQSHLWPSLKLDGVNLRSHTVLHCCLMNGGNVQLLGELLTWWQRQQLTHTQTQHLPTQRSPTPHTDTETQPVSEPCVNEAHIATPAARHDVADQSPGRDSHMVAQSVTGADTGASRGDISAAATAVDSAAHGVLGGAAGGRGAETGADRPAADRVSGGVAADGVLGGAAGGRGAEVGSRVAETGVAVAGSADISTLPCLQDVLRVRSDQDRCPLTCAVMDGQWECVRWLVAVGALHTWTPPRSMQETAQPHIKAAPSESTVIQDLPRMIGSLLPHTPTSLVEAARQLPQALRIGYDLLRTYTLRTRSTLQQQLSDAERTAVHAGFLSSSAEGRAMQASEAMSALQSAVEQVQVSLHVDESTALSLLFSHNYDLDSLLTSHMANAPETALQPTDAAPYLSTTQQQQPASQQDSQQATGGLLKGTTTGVSGLQASVLHGGTHTQRCIVCWEEVDACHTHRTDPSGHPDSVCADSAAESDKRRPTASVSLPCGHVTCDTCWSGTLQAQLESGTPWRVVCAAAGCGTPLPHNAALRLLTPAARTKYNNLMGSHYVTRHPRVTWCPRPGCTYTVTLGAAPTQTSAPSHTLDDSDGTAPAPAAAGPAAQPLPADVQSALLRARGVAVRCACGRRFCFRCGGPAHEPAACADVERFSRSVRRWRAAAAAATEAYLSAHTRKCPRCAAPTERVEGCNHMVCSMCRAHWCWECGQDWALHGRDTGGYYRCNLTPTSHTDPTTNPTTNNNTNSTTAMAVIDRQLQRFSTSRAFRWRARALLGRLVWYNDLVTSSNDLATAWVVSNGGSGGCGGLGLVRVGLGSESFGSLLGRWYRVLCDSSDVLAWGHVKLATLGPTTLQWMYLHRKLSHLEAALTALIGPVDAMPAAEHTLATARQLQRAARTPPAHASQLTAWAAAVAAAASAAAAPWLRTAAGAHTSNPFGNHPNTNPQASSNNTTGHSNKDDSGTDRAWDSEVVSGEQNTTDAALTPVQPSAPAAATHAAPPSPALTAQFLYAHKLASHYTSEITQLITDVETASGVLVRVARLGHLEDDGGASGGRGGVASRATQGADGAALAPQGALAGAVVDVVAGAVGGLLRWAVGAR